MKQDFEIDKSPLDYFIITASLDISFIKDKNFNEKKKKKIKSTNEVKHNIFKQLLSHCIWLQNCEFKKRNNRKLHN